MFDVLAHARLMFRKEVLVQDAVVAIQMVEMSMQNTSLLGSSNALHSHAPADPDVECILYHFCSFGSFSAVPSHLEVT